MQKILTTTLGRTIELKTREWDMQCSGCGQVADLWESGGVRIGGYGKKKIYALCKNCDSRFWFTVCKKNIEN